MKESENSFDSLNLNKGDTITKSVSGFIEWQPKVKIIEEKWIQRITENYRRNGFIPVETAGVEYLTTLQLKGEIDKEIYCLSKLGSAATKELALHYDLTIPLARFVTENFSKIAFPFKRYQIQKVWRGERPQFGRYREFYQADIDVIDSGALPEFYDAEVLCVGIESMIQMNISDFRVGISNRKIYEGYLKGIGISEVVPILRIIDKIDKIGVDGVLKQLVDICMLDIKLAEKCVLLAQTKYQKQTSSDLIKQLNVNHELFDQGLRELDNLVQNISLIARPEVVNVIDIDFSFVRGFDYYTGSIFEGKFIDNLGYGSICSGGRYDNLAEGFGNRKLPGVGFSIGLTRILAKHEEKAVELADYPQYTTQCCVILEGDNSTSSHEKLIQIGVQLKDSGFTVNMLPVSKLKKGLQIASRLEVALVIFKFDEKYMMKQLKSGTQVELNVLQSLAEQVRPFLN